MSNLFKVGIRSRKRTLSAGQLLISPVPPARGTHHVQSLAAGILLDAVVRAADLALLLRLLLGSLRLLSVVHDLHGPPVDLREVVVLDRAGGRRRLAVDDGGSAQVPTKLVHIKRSPDERTALGKELLQVLHTHGALIDAPHSKFSLGKRALDLHSVVVAVYLVVLGHDGSHGLPLLQTVYGLSTSVVLQTWVTRNCGLNLRFAHWLRLQLWCRGFGGSTALIAIFACDWQHPGSTDYSQRLQNSSFRQVSPAYCGF